MRKSSKKQEDDYRDSVKSETEEQATEERETEEL